MQRARRIHSGTLLAVTGEEMAPGTDSGFAKRTMLLGEVEVIVQSYRVGSRWAAKVETSDVGNSIGRSSGETRELAEAAALDSAKLVLEMRSAADAFRTSAQRLKG
jgi:hypothetical protein